MTIGPCSEFIRACIQADRSAIQAVICREGWSWDSLLEGTSRESLLPALSGLLGSLDLEGDLPASISEFLSAVKISNRERNEVIFGELKAAVALLNKAGIEPVLLKGLAYLVAGVYQDPGARHLLDIDLLIPAEQVNEAAGILLDNGFFAEHQDPFGRFRHHLPPLRRPGSVWIELHDRLGMGKCEQIMPAREVIAQSAPYDLEGLRARIPCPEHLLVHLIMHSQMQHTYYERIWPPLRAMYDLSLLNRRFGPELRWDAVAARFSASGQYASLVLHLMQVKDSTGMELPFEVRAGLPTRLRWERRQVLRRWPALRYLDPVYMFSSVLGRRLRMLRKLLSTRKGIRHLLSQISAPGNYARIWTDLIQGRGR